MEYISKVVIFFMHQHFFIFRKIHVAQKLPEYYLDKIHKFLLIIQN